MNRTNDDVTPYRPVNRYRTTRYFDVIITLQPRQREPQNQSGEMIHSKSIRRDESIKMDQER
jgi:hypothetical protein